MDFRSVFGRLSKPKNILIAIIFLGAVLRFWGLGSSEIFHDESFYAFRSIGYLDYIQNESQSTPVQWFKDSVLPWWTGLSFHDHPPFLFIVQNFFFRLFGDSLLAARLPSFFAGVGTIFLTYLIIQRLFKKTYLSLIAAGLLSVNHIHIWISRSSLMESLLIFLIVFNIYCFLRFLEDNNKWPFFGVTLGLVFLTKYTGFFLAPVYLLIGLIGLMIRFRLPQADFVVSRILKNRRFYASLGLAFLIFSPVIVYNFYLYKTTGHFDLQFSYLFRQEAPEWAASVGKVQEPFSNFLPNLMVMYSAPFLIAVFGGLIYAGYRAYKLDGVSVFFLIVFIFITMELLFVGSAYRFLSLYLTPFIFLVVLLFDFVYRRFLAKKKQSGKKIIFGLLAAFFVYEAFFAVDGIFITYPDFGVVKLDNYFDEIFGGKRSLVTPQSPNVHLDKVIQKYAKKYQAAKKAIVIVYDENIALSTRLWLFTRRLYYHGILTLTAGQFKGLLRTQGTEPFQNADIYFVKASPYTSLNPYISVPDAVEFEQFLRQNLGLQPMKTIYGRENQPMFQVYKFLL